MSRLTKAMACLTLACLTALTPVATAANAAGAADAGPLEPAGQVQPMAPDGNLYAYINTDFDINGGFCKWPNNQTHWGDGACRNRASSLWNNGYAHTYDDVLVFWGLNYSGASYCVSRGWALPNLRNLAFNRPGPGTPGYSQTLDDNISSHYWAHNGTC